MKHLYPYLRRFRKESILAPLFKMLEATFDLLGADGGGGTSSRSALRAAIRRTSGRAAACWC